MKGYCCGDFALRAEEAPSEGVLIEAAVAGAPAAGELAPFGASSAGLALGWAAPPGGLGAETPAMSEPRPIFWRLSASSFPVGSIPFAD